MAPLGHHRPLYHVSNTFHKRCFSGDVFKASQTYLKKMFIFDVSDMSQKYILVFVTIQKYHAKMVSC